MNAEDSSRFARPVVCAWCGNKHRSVMPFGKDSENQGDDCATNVFQVTAELHAIWWKDLKYLTLFDGKKMTAVEKFPALATVQIGDWLAKGNYGSTQFDCEIWKWVKNFPEKPAEPICDNCLGERICAEDLIRIDGNFP